MFAMQFIICRGFRETLYFLHKFFINLEWPLKSKIYQ